MNRKLIAIVGVFAVLGIAAISGQAFAQASTPWHVTGEVLQELSGFDNPEGSVFGLGGRTLYISNAAVWDCEGFAFVENGGYISKLSVSRTGKVSIANAKLATGITAPLGTADCNIVQDRSRHKPGVAIIDSNGKKLGFLNTGFGSAFEPLSSSD